MPKGLLIGFFLMFGAEQAYAAHITDVAQGNDGTNVITIEGAIELDDDKRFLVVISNIDNGKGIVALNSPGGNLIAGLAIGSYIHDHGFATYVPDHTECASVCAAIWVAGRVRNVASTARIGFHAAYDMRTGVEKGNMNALVGAYLSQVGISYPAIIYMTSAAPNGMQWLSKEDADKLGISYQVLDLDEQPETFVRTPSQSVTPQLSTGVETPTAPQNPVPPLEGVESRSIWEHSGSLVRCWRRRVIYDDSPIIDRDPKLRRRE